MHRLPDRFAGPPGPTAPVATPDRGRQARRRCWTEMTLIGLSLFVYMLGGYHLSRAAYLLIMRAGPELLLNEWAVELIGWGISCVICPLLMLLILRRVSTRDLPARREQEMNPGRMLRYCVAAYGCAIGSNFITVMITGFLARQGNEVSDALTDMVETTESMSLLALSLVLVAPVAEELIFRHLLLRRLRKYGDGFCMFATAFAFSLCHANIPQMLYAFTLGLLLAYTVLRHGHIIYSILMHAFINFMGFLAFGFQRAGGERSAGLFTGFALLVALIGAIFLVAGHARVRLNRSALPLGLPYRCVSFLCNPGSLFFISFVLYRVWLINFR